MTYDISKAECGNYGFHFLDDMEDPAAQLQTIGLEHRTSTDYCLDGMKRKDGKKYIFQYTLSGSGVLLHKGTEYNLEPGQAFLIEVPGDNKYYLSGKSQKWRFVYISLIGNEVEKRWNEIAETFGCIVNFDIDSALIKCLFNIYREAENKKIIDCYHSSVLAYQFLMELYRALRKNSGEEQPELVRKAIQIMQDCYDSLYGIEEIAKRIEVSKFYLIRLFNRHLGISPAKYLTKIRLEKAIELLNNTELTIENIAYKVGYANANYFIKVFRRYLCTSPGEFRSDNKIIPYTYLRL